LADIGGQPMIEHVYRRASAARSVGAVVVATDDQRIAEVVRAFGGVARMTRPTHRSGTDRVAEVADDLACEIVVNVQGDEPLVEPGMIEQLIAPFDEDMALPMTTLCRPAGPQDLRDPNVVKVVTDRMGNALYFSRASIPFVRDLSGGTGTTVGALPVYQHIGLYAYRRTFLRTFARLAHTPLEMAESLEQLRALEHGFRIRTVLTHYDSIGVDTPEDLERVRRRFSFRGQHPTKLTANVGAQERRHEAAT
jgi:3-deoxy-manno-octulosonate cytidylyltransferase (CMP-KDO synthetase)